MQQMTGHGCMRQVWFLILFFAFGANAFAANHYVRAGALGSGSDWTNPCGNLTGGCALVRGDTYYIATGSYGNLSINVPTSGTTLITIKGATAADHGTDIGWNNSFGVDVTQARFSGISLGSSMSYLVIDGNTGDPSVSSDDMGFAILLSGDCGGDRELITVGGGSTASTHVTFSHFSLLSCTGDYQRFAFFEPTTGARVQYLTLSYIRFDGWQVAVYSHDDYETFDHNYILNPYSSSNHHGNQVDIIDGSTHMTISNNYFASCFGTTCMGANDTGGNCTTGLQTSSIFGNVLQGDNGANGVIAATTRCFIATTKVYNNTIYNNSVPWLMVCFANGNCGRATGNSAENNLVYRSNCDSDINGGVKDYNTYSNCMGGSGSGEPHGQYVSTNFLVNPSGGDFNLATDTAAWNPSNIPDGDNQDPSGALRTSSRGAYQYNGAPAPLSITTSSLPDGISGSSYNAPLSCSAGTCTWSASGLPSGLAVSGQAINGVPETSGSYSVGVTATSGNQSASKQFSLSVTDAPPPSAIQSFWTNSDTPANITGNDSPSVELGLKFSSSVSGSIVGIKFYKATNSNVTHTGTLWNSKGSKLASGTFSNESAYGWQTLTFSSPVAITAGATYTISYHTSQYVWNLNYFNNPFTVGSLTAPVNAGVYRYGSTPAFPTSVWQAGNYWVDVLFLPDVVPVSVSVSPGSATLIPGQTQQFMATVSNATNQGVTWSANAPNGLFTATTPGAFTITATSLADNSKSDSATIVVNPPPATLGPSSCTSTSTTITCVVPFTNMPSGTFVSGSMSGAGAQSALSVTLP